MSRRVPKTISLITTDGDDVTIRASSIETIGWANGMAGVTNVAGAKIDVAMDLPTYNALVADWALSAPGRTPSLRFAIRANARAGRLTGVEVWPRNKP